MARVIIALAEAGILASDVVILVPESLILISDVVIAVFESGIFSFRIVDFLVSEAGNLVSASGCVLAAFHQQNQASPAAAAWDLLLKSI